MKFRNCECCGGGYSTGKDYGNTWHQYPVKAAEYKGLCTSCNPKHTQDFHPALRCHNADAVPLGEPCPRHDFLKSLDSPLCIRCGALESAFNFWAERGVNYQGHGITVSI